MIKKKFEFVIGLFALLEVVYKIFTCPSCEDSILWFQVSGFVYILFWAMITMVLFYGFYKENWLKKEVGE